MKTSTENEICECGKHYIHSWAIGNNKAVSLIDLGTEEVFKDFTVGDEGVPNRWVAKKLAREYCKKFIVLRTHQNRI